MVKKTFYLIILSCILFFFSNCRKESVVKNESGQVIVQGKITLKVQAKHHWWGVSYLPVYLKKNVTTWPGTDSTKYELKTVTDSDGNCEFDHLFPGNYYLYAHGFDSYFGMNVIGYHSIELNSSTAPDNELDFTLIVSE
jgi:hypothetical protein